MKVVLFSYHCLASKVQAGFHHLAAAYWDLGWDVVFVTAPLSPLSLLVRDRRLTYPVLREANSIRIVRDRLASYVLFSRVHPANLRFARLNELTGKLLVREYQRSSLGALEAELSRADLVVFESTSAILLAPLVKQIATSARLVYRVSDDLAILRVHPAVVDAEREVLPLFDYVSAPNRYSVERVGRVREAAFDPHAIAKHLFDRETARPYHSEFNAVWVGSASLDATFLTHAAERLPHLAFHLIGRGRRAVSRPNIAWHGELPYESTVPFLQHADVGLAAYGGVGGRIPSYWADSTKIVQYAYCGLPIVAPSALRSEREHVFYYEPDDPESIEAAVKTALAAGRRSEVGRTIPSWHELARTLAGQTGNPSRTTNQRRASRDALESA